MDKADALGLQFFRTHRRYQLGGSARCEYEAYGASMARIAARGSDEISQRRGTFATGNPAAMIRILATRRSCSIRRIRDHQVEAGGLDADYFLAPQVGADRAHRSQIINRRVARDHLGQLGLNL